LFGRRIYQDHYESPVAPMGADILGKVLQ
jgi:hypothetical protein